MERYRLTWLFGLLATTAALGVPIALFWPRAEPALGAPKAPQSAVHTDHHDIVAGPFASGQDVTRACLGCHPRAAGEVMATSHWTWISDEASAPGLAQPLPVGKILHHRTGHQHLCSPYRCCPGQVSVYLIEDKPREQPIILPCNRQSTWRDTC